MLFKSINILIVEDNPGDFLLIRSYLAASRLDTRDIINATTMAHAVELLAANFFDIILLDLSLPDSVGIKSYACIKDKSDDLPIIILSGSNNEDLALEIVRQGAQDYLIKDDLDERILAKSILYSIERKKNLASLTQSQMQYQFLFDNNPLAMWTYDVETLKFMMVNNAAIVQYGYSREEFLAMTILDIRPEEEFARLIEVNNSREAFPYRYNGEWKHIRKDGVLIHVEITSYLIEHPDKVNHSDRKLRLVVANDITERVRAKAELEKSERIFRSVAESFPNGAIDLLDAKLNVIYTNGLEYKRLGLDPSQYVGHNFLEHQDSKLKMELKARLLDSLNGDTVTFETRRRGNIYNSIAAPLAGADGSTEKLLVITQNITEQYRIGQHLKLLESVVINSANGVMIVDNPRKKNELRKIIFANKALEDITGYAIDELIGKNPQIFQGRETDPASIHKIRTAIKKHIPVEAELINYKKNGTPYWVHLSIVPIFDNNRTCTHYIGLSRDVTERRLADEKIKRANERYEMLSKATNEAIWEWNIMDDEIIWSKAIHTIFGYTERDTKYTDLNWWKKKIHPKDRKRVLKKFTGNIIEKEATRIDEYLFLCKSGEYKMVYDRSFVTYDEHTRQAVRIIGSLQDITELHNKELQLLEQNLKIYEIAQINSHVIRKPVASILGLINVLDKSRVQDPETYQIMEHLEVCARELDEVIHTIAQKAIQ